jgi:hypothetical protein
MKDDLLRRRVQSLQVKAPNPFAQEAALDRALEELATARATSVVTTALASRPRWGWREWLWPSPQAWGACALVWTAFLLTNRVPADHPKPASSPSSASFPFPASTVQLLAGADLKSLSVPPKLSDPN